MSSFTPGFAGRHRAAAHVLQRAFSDPVGFAPAPVDTIGRRSFPEPSSAPKHFTPANPDTNPTEGWDPFAAEMPRTDVSGGAFSDPIAAAHAAGLAEGRA